MAVAQVATEECRRADVSTAGLDEPHAIDAGRLAIVTRASDEVASIRWHRDPRTGAAPLPGVRGFWQVPVGAVRPDSPAEPRLGALALRQAERLHAAQGLFASGAMEVGDLAFCERGENADQNVTVFSGIRLAGSEYNVHTRGLKDVIRELNTAATFDQVAILTGVCLFSDRSLSLKTEDGERMSVIDIRKRRPQAPLTTIEEDTCLSLYELESCARLGRFTADLVTALPDGPRMSISLDVPRVQYYCYLLDLLTDGLIDEQLLQRWFSVVDRRRDRIVSLVREHLGSDLSVAEIQETTGLNPLIPAIKSALQAGRTPTVGELLAQLTHHDPLWRDVARLTSPATHVELGYLSYAVEELRVASCGEPAARRLGVVVDNRQERRTYERAERLAKALRRHHPQSRSRLVGFFPLERVLAADGSPTIRSNDPGQHLVDDTHRRWTPARLVERVHGRVITNSDPTLGVVALETNADEFILPALRRFLGSHVRVLARSMLDNLTPQEQQLLSLREQPDEDNFTVPLRDDRVLDVSTQKAYRLIQHAIDELERAGASHILVLCTAPIDTLTTDGATLLMPERIMTPIVTSRWNGRPVGIVVPLSSQETEAAAQWAAAGVTPIPTSLPIGADDEEVQRAARHLAEQRVDGIVLDCMGYDERLRAAVRRATHIPTVLPTALVASVLAEVL